ncbi:MAG: hypothetical protein RI894_431 [Bacteroidota bacterium]|jgi:hypothetical protein
MFLPKLRGCCLCYLVLLLGFSAVASAKSERLATDTIPKDYQKTAALIDLDTVSTRPAYLKGYLENIETTLSQTLPVLSQLPFATDTLLAKAQQLAFTDARMTQYLRDAKTGKSYRNEVFGVYAARQSDFTQADAATFYKGACFRVELYNFALNLATVAVVSLPENRVLQVYLLPATQPDIPQKLKALALRIATESGAVQAALGFKPTENDALMSDTKTALNRTRCERSQHLCVAPTFVKGDKALWAIVDLTDLRLVGVRWTNVGASPQNKKAITERQLQNETLTECFCKKETTVERNNWKLNYMLTSSDGLRVSDVSFGAKAVLFSAKLVDWHVSYSNTDGFGYSDAVGCPYFSTAAVVAIETPKVHDLVDSGGKTIGFVVEQSFYSEGWPNPCNYNYQQRYEFYNDGKFRMACASFGRGCGNDGTYRPVLRIAMAGNQNTLSEWTGDSWAAWQKERYQLQLSTTPYTPEGYQYKISTAANTGYYIEPSTGQFNDKGRGDNAYFYTTVNHPDKPEGESDLVTIGPCCNTDYRQGPEKFVEGEAATNETLVLWYVPQLKNDDTKGHEYCWAEAYLKDGVWNARPMPCWAGPLFIPIK